MVIFLSCWSWSWHLRFRMNWDWARRWIILGWSYEINYGNWFLLDWGDQVVMTTQHLKT